MFKKLFRRKEPDTVKNPERQEDGLFQAIWTRKKLPDPGALVYAWETLGLPPFTTIGAGVAVRHPYKPIQAGPQPYFPRQMVALQGFGIVSGGVVQQPLFNPRYRGYGGLTPLANNDANPRGEIMPAGYSTS